MTCFASYIYLKRLTIILFTTICKSLQISRYHSTLRSKRITSQYYINNSSRFSLIINSNNSINHDLCSIITHDKHYIITNHMYCSCITKMQNAIDMDMILIKVPSMVESDRYFKTCDIYHNRKHLDVIVVEDISQFSYYKIIGEEDDKRDNSISNAIPPTLIFTSLSWIISFISLLKKRKLKRQESSIFIIFALILLYSCIMYITPYKVSVIYFYDVKFYHKLNYKNGMLIYLCASLSIISIIFSNESYLFSSLLVTIFTTLIILSDVLQKEEGESKLLLYLCCVYILFAADYNHVSIVRSIFVLLLTIYMIIEAYFFKQIDYQAL